MADNKTQIYLATAIAIAFIAFFVAYGTDNCSAPVNINEDTKQEQLIEDEQPNNQNEGLFIGCNGFF